MIKNATVQPLQLRTPNSAGKPIIMSVKMEIIAFPKSSVYLLVPLSCLSSSDIR